MVSFRTPSHSPHKSNDAKAVELRAAAPVRAAQGQGPADVAHLGPGEGTKERRNEPPPV